MQDYLLFIDTETSGLPKKWDLPYCDNDNWPYALQVSWIVYTSNMQEVKREDHYIKDNDFTISEKARAVHGLTQEYLVEHGEWRKDVMTMLANDLQEYQPLVIGHFIELDLNVAGVEFYRTGITNPLQNLKTFCTMLATTKWVQNPQVKYLRLNQLYEVLFNKTLDRQHNALEDAEATAECFFEMLKRGDITADSVEHQEVYLQKSDPKKIPLPAAIVLILIIIIAFGYMVQRLEFLSKVSPFNLLPADVLEQVADQLQEIRYSKDTVIYQQEVTKMRGVDIIAEGEYESFFYDSQQNKRLLEHHHPGYCYGGISVLLNRKQSIRTVIARKGTTVFFLHRKDFRSLCKAYEDFVQYFTADFGKRMLNDEFAHFYKRPATFEESYIASEQMYSRKIESIEYREIVSCPQSTPVYEAARLMAKHKVSCIFIRDEQSKIVGYVTDITLRDNVVSKQADTAQPVGNVMDNPIVCISTNAYVYEAILMMFRTKTRYLLIKNGDEFVGSISRNKLLAEQAQSPLVFIQSVKQAISVQELKRKWESVPQMVTQLLGRGVNAEIVNQVITTIADTIAIKVIENVIAVMGQPPAKFVFMVLGSEGRKEQTFKTDQDNAIIYEDKANEHRELVREYFLSFAQQVSEKLDHIGFSFCTGGYMAQNPKWTHSLSHWKRNYESWMTEAVPETVIQFSTFFDCRYLYGEASIMDELKEFLDEELQKPLGKIFFHMAKNALQYEPPLTFFKNIKTFTKGSQEVFDIKKSMTPIVDLVRMYALRHRIFEVNTGERLKALKEKEVFNEKEVQELMQSYYFLMGLRLRNQASQIIQDRTEPDNYIDPDKLTKIEKVALKEIFKTIDNFQTRIKLEFTNNLFG